MNCLWQHSFNFLLLLAGAMLPSATFALSVEETEKSQPAPAAVEKAVEPATPADPLDTLFITWQRDPTTTATIQWFGPASGPEIPKVRYSPRKGSADIQEQSGQRIPFPQTDQFLYRVELEKLVPATEYKIAIGEGSYWFRTMPAKASRPIQFVSGGDSGVNGAAARSNARAGEQDPDFIVIGGDIAYDNAKAPLLWIRFFRQYHQTVKAPGGRLVPLVVGLGNHEVLGGYLQPRSKAPFFLTTFSLYAERTFASLDVGDYLSLVLLDSGHVTRIEGPQTEWLEKTLAERQERPHVFVYYHVPAWPSVRPFLVGELQRKHWVPLFEKYGVDAVFEHHDHAFKRTHPLRAGKVDPTGIVYFGDGAWGQIRVPRTPQQSWYLAASTSAHHIYVHRLDGPRRAHVAIDEFGRVIDIYPQVGPPPVPKQSGTLQKAAATSP